jgi:hypothetical protein
MPQEIKTRREILSFTVAAAAAPACSLLLGTRKAWAQELEHLTEDDPMAMALMYVHDAANANNPRYEPGQMCSNCQQIQGEEGQEWRPCLIFPGKLVAAGGWCSVWTQKVG